jgi:ABC-type transport system involved in multi-copper enzyme maturation permease subunit
VNYAPNWPVIRQLAIKDWQIFQKQLAAYVLAGIGALALLGLAKPWSFYVGSLLLIVLLVAASAFAISTSLLVERKERTLAFVMSLPVSPLDFTLAKLAGNLVTFAVPFLVMLTGTLLVILGTPLPDGLLVYATLVFGHLWLAYCVSLAVAMHVESEGWNTFVMIGTNLLVNPFMVGIGQIESIAGPARGDVVLWSLPAVLIALAQLALGLAALGWTAWSLGRRPAFY